MMLKFAKATHYCTNKMSTLNNKNTIQHKRNTDKLI